MPPPERTAGLVAAIGLHAAAVALLLSYAPARSALLAAAPIMVDLLAPPAPVVEPKPEPRIDPPKPRPVRRKVQRPVEPPPVVTAPVQAPAPIEAPPPPPAPPPMQAVAPPAPEPVAAPPPAPAPLTQPIFQADYLDNPAPAYPALSRRIGEEGRVVLRVLVNPAGLADQIEVRTSSGHPRLDDAARTTVARWRFVPAKRGDQPVAAWVLIPISFRLEG
jgi:protein TonB